MPISIHNSGTRTSLTPPEVGFTVLGSASDTTAGVFQFFIDCSNMTSTDEISVQILEKVLPGGPQKVVFTSTINGVQSEPIWVSPSLILFNSWQIQVKQTLGTARTFDWSIRKVA